MKKISFFARTLAIPTLALVMITNSCQRDNTPAPAGGTFTPSAGARQFAVKTNDFSFDFLKNVNQLEKKDKNIFISPLSLHMALGMLLNGANGKTAEEMRKTLKLDEVSAQDANEVYKQLLEGLPKADPKVTTRLANAIFYRNDFSVEPDFLNLSRNYFSAQVAAEDFSNQAAALAKINRWASDNTNGKIPTVLTEITRDQVMFLLNALYFKGDWKIPFDPKATYDAPFQITGDQQKTVKMMNLNTNLRRAYRQNYSAVELPYGDGTYRMTVLLPATNSSADALVQSLNATEWAQLQQSMTEGKTMVGMPKFTLEYEKNLNDELKAMGMPTAFSQFADFSKISKSSGLAVSFVKQNTFVAVDEKGTEAAAVTTIGVELTSVGPAPIICDRPFVVLITEQQTGAVLFMGKIVNPESK